MLPRRNRIPTEKFPGITRGKVYQNDLLRVVLFYEKKLKVPKCAVIVSSKVSKTAVARNRVRRQVYGLLGQELLRLPLAYISIFPKRADFSDEELRKSIKIIYEKDK